MNLTIDGKPIQAPKGAMLLQVALDNGIWIPHYCYHPGLSIDGSCRLCQVKIEKNPKLQISCNTPVAEGMVVSTDAPEVVKARRGVIELLLLNHPLDCPICDQAGECLLQDYSFAYGSGVSRQKEPRRKAMKRVDVGPRVVLDQERCILCRRCVRFCSEITKTREIAVLGIGDTSVVNVNPDFPLDNDYSVCVADACPVGALLSKDYHHRLRVWSLRETESICPACSNGCNIRISTYRNRIWRLLPRRNDAVNAFWMCDAGRLGYGYVQDASRIRAASVRTNGEAKPVERLDAIRLVVSKMAALGASNGPESIGAIGSGLLTNEELFLLARLAGEVWGSPNLDLAFPAGKSDNLLIKAEKAANVRGGRDVGLKPGPGGLDARGMIEAAAAGKVKGLLIAGSSAANLVPAELLSKAVRRIEFLAVMDIRPSVLTEKAHAVIPSLSWAEKEGTFTNHAGRVQRIHRAIHPDEGALTDGEVFARMLDAAGSSVGWFSPERVFQEIRKRVPAYANLDLATLGRLGAESRPPDGGAAPGDAKGKAA